MIEVKNGVMIGYPVWISRLWVFVSQSQRRLSPGSSKHRNFTRLQCEVQWL